MRSNPQVNSLLTECESMIRIGRMDLVGKKLSGLNTAQVSRELRLPLANVARRAGLIATGLKLLRPVAHPEERGRLSCGASPRELAEYGALLLRSGAVQHALWTLGQVRPKDAPDVLLNRAFCHFALREYEESLVVLQQYVREEDRAYQRLVGMVNWAAALVSLDRWEEAGNLLTEIFKISESGGYMRVQANALELRARISIYKKEYLAARADLTIASEILKDSSSMDQLWVKKWRAVLHSIKNHDPSEVEHFQQEALARKSWESIRDTDWFLLKIRFDQQRFGKLLFGTPFPSFRKKLLSEFRCGHATFHLYGSNAGRVLDLQTGGFVDRGGVTPPLKIYHLLSVLARDFYRPIKVGGLFAELFPGEYFDIFSSVNRVRQLVYRTRQWLGEFDTDAEILEDEGAYSLRMGDRFGLIIPFEVTREPKAVEELRLSTLRLKFFDEPFSSLPARECLDISTNAFKLLMTWAIERGYIVRLGGGRSTEYRFVKAAQAA